MAKPENGSISNYKLDYPELGYSSVIFAGLQRSMEEFVNRVDELSRLRNRYDSDDADIVMILSLRGLVNHPTENSSGQPQ